MFTFVVLDLGPVFPLQIKSTLIYDYVIHCISHANIDNLVTSLLV